jgi:hypothetical protein
MNSASNPRRCNRCFADISSIWHVVSLCNRCLDMEIRMLKARNEGRVLEH